MNIDLKSQHLSTEYGLELLLCANDLPILLFSGLIQKFQSERERTLIRALGQGNKHRSNSYLSGQPIGLLRWKVYEGLLINMPIHTWLVHGL